MSRLILLLIVPVLIAACINPPPEELDRSVFIADTQYPDLPAYTEWGYNTFGAHYNEDVFLYTSSVTARATKDTLTFEFCGTLKKASPHESVTVYFSLAEKHPSTYADLVALHAASFDLTSPTAITSLYVNGKRKKGTISNGHLQFKRAQYLLVNGQPDRVILSGYFDFQFLTDTHQTITVKDGRFDIGINGNNFYMY
ncbi:MAG: hypothetical protein DI538_01045 [Azospira oryzae]|jgi:hypothetical protein|nr:MAG: hypothetical protein DI538_01045 [Azospira oryzae]